MNRVSSVVTQDGPHCITTEADEDTQVGSQFLDHQDKVKASASGEDGGKRYKEQLDKIHCVLLT